MLNDRDRLALLIPTQAFHQLDLAKYKECGRKKKLFKGESLAVNARDKDDLYFFYVDSGQVSMVFQQESGESMSVTVRCAGNAMPGQYNNLAAIGRYDAQLIANENSVIFAFSQRDMYNLAQQDETLFYEFIHVYHMSIAQLAHRLSIISNQSATQRMVMWLQKLSSLKGADERGVVDIECRLTLHQLAEYLSIHLTTCTKLVATLESKGLIKRTRTRIQILDVPGLEQYALETSPLI